MQYICCHTFYQCQCQLSHNRQTHVLLHKQRSRMPCNYRYTNTSLSLSREAAIGHAWHVLGIGGSIGAAICRQGRPACTLHPASFACNSYGSPCVKATCRQDIAVYSSDATIFAAGLALLHKRCMQPVYFSMHTKVYIPLAVRPFLHELYMQSGCSSLQIAAQTLRMPQVWVFKACAWAQRQLPSVLGKATAESKRQPANGQWGSCQWS